MANEIAINAALAAYKSTIMSSPIGRSANGYSFTMTGNVLTEGVVLVSHTAAAAIPLGQVSQPHWAWLKNLDTSASTTVNYITVRNGSGGADLMQLYPGEVAVFPFYISAVPYAIANTADCLLEYVIFTK